jgi:hypothetical protein
LGISVLGHPHAARADILVQQFITNDSAGHFYAIPESSDESAPEVVLRLTLAPAGLKFLAGKEFDVVFIEEGHTVGEGPTCPANVLDAPLQADGSLVPCVSDLARFVNNGANGEIWFASDLANVADTRQFPPLAAVHLPAVQVSEHTAPSAFNQTLVSLSLDNGRILRVHIDSDANSFRSDGIGLTVPGLPPLGTLGLALLLALSAVWLLRRPRAHVA